VLIGLVQSTWFSAGRRTLFVVSFLVALAGWRLGNVPCHVADTAPAVHGRTSTLIEHTSGVPHQSLRLRPAGLTLLSAWSGRGRRRLIHCQAERYAHREDRAEISSADATVTVNPVALDDETVFQRDVLPHAAISLPYGSGYQGQLAVSFDRG
jgi:hypothetical protein